MTVSKKTKSRAPSADRLHREKKNPASETKAHTPNQVAGELLDQVHTRSQALTDRINTLRQRLG